MVLQRSLDVGGKTAQTHATYLVESKKYSAGDDASIATESEASGGKIGDRESERNASRFDCASKERSATCCSLFHQS